MKGNVVDIYKAFDRESNEVEFLATEILGWTSEAEEEGTAIHVGVLLRRNDWGTAIAKSLGHVVCRSRCCAAAGTLVADRLREMARA